MINLHFYKVTPIAASIKNPTNRSREFVFGVWRAITDVPGVAYATEAHADTELRWNVFLTPGGDEDTRKGVIRNLRTAIEGVAENLGIED